MSEHHRRETVEAAYRQTLQEISEVRASQLRTWPPVRPVSRNRQAVRLGTSAQALRLREEENQLVSTLQRLEDRYRACGGDMADLYSLAAGSADSES